MSPNMPFDLDETVSDDALMVLYANGDAMAARELAHRHLATVVAFAKRLISSTSDAEDIAQEVMLRLWKIAPDWRQGEAKVTTWLYRVTRNLCIDRLRQRSFADIDEVAEPIDTAPSVQDAMETSQRVAALDAALSQLPERQREAIVLRHIEGLSNPEIGEIMGISVEAVESLTARGKRLLKSALETRKKELGWS